MIQGVEYYKIADLAPTGITVQRGHTLDGLGKYYLETIEQADGDGVDIRSSATTS